MEKSNQIVGKLLRQNSMEKVNERISSWNTVA
jgi:hypothetical protein